MNGNHDVLVQGNFVPAGLAKQAIGDQSDGGTRDWSQPGGPVVDGQVPADPARALLEVVDLLTTVASTGDGHGIDADVIARDRALYSFVSGGVRILVVDSAAATGGAEGVIHQADVDAFIAPTLDEAEAQGEPVIVTSHHCSGSLGDGGGLGGSTQDDALTTDEWRALLGDYPGVIMHLCAHSHTHRVEVIEPLGGHAYWEVRTASLADQPQEMRLVEVRDEDNGMLSITGIAVDYATPDDLFAEGGRARAIADYTAAWHGDGSGELDDRNVRLWIAWP
ncbi:MAG: hypothetical protein KC420_01890 [Myxococcales bacterium]|nr:hypothetical protein [Myxococcales bacterium]